jgi:hypothetical protein
MKDGMKEKDDAKEESDVWHATSRLYHLVIIFQPLDRRTLILGSTNIYQVSAICTCKVPFTISPILIALFRCCSSPKDLLDAQQRQRRDRAIM